MSYHVNNETNNNIELINDKEKNTFVANASTKNLTATN